MKPLTIEDVIHRKDEMISSRSENEWLAMDANTMTFFAFQGPSARIWELLETSISVRSLVGKLVEEYEIDEASCVQDTLAHLGKLLEEGVIGIVSPDRN
jgi:hypothetical protein